jgi:four helix bundle protein
MGVRDYRELHAWQVARELADRIIRMTRQPEWRTEFDRSRQMQRAAQSVCANIAEGFGRFSHRDFCRFLRIAKGSAFELQEHIHDARVRELITQEEANTLLELSRRTVGSIVPLIRYLEKN